LGDLLHKGAANRDGLADEEQPVVADFKRGKGLAAQLSNPFYDYFLSRLLTSC
jgi:hypothetical protein